MGDGIQDEVAQGSFKRKWSGLDDHGGFRFHKVEGISVTEIRKFADDFAEKPADIDHLDGILAHFLAHKQNGAIRDGVQFLEVRQPFAPLFVVFDEFCPQAHAGHWGSQVMASGCDETHSAFHCRLQAAGEFVQGSRRGADFTRTCFRQMG
ncbi:hypothetical protein D3C87_1671350 [compost metagenome]